MNNFSKNLLLWATISVVMVVLFNMFSQPPAQEQRLSYSELLTRIQNGEVTEVKIQGQRIQGVLLNEQRFVSFNPNDPELVSILLDNNVRVVGEPEDTSPWYFTVLISWFPFLLLIGVWIFFMRQMQSGGGRAMSFGRSRAKMLSEESTKVTFEDVAGVDEAKDELMEVVEFLREPKKFTRLGGRIPKGVLLVGSPGTGKTLLARAVAGEAGVPFFSISGSDFVEMFVGVGAARVRDLFTQGKKNAPCLIFIDEIDAVGRQRGAGLGGGHDEREQTLNQMLVEMDGFESNEGVILIAATNRPDVLDPALLRPGRFDRQVVVPAPDLRGRARILQVHAKRSPLAKGVDLELLAKGTPGMSGADLENLVNEAALHAARKGKEQLDMLDFEEAKDKLLMGKERRSMILSEDEKKTTAYHEAGHALVARLLPGTDPVHKVSIIPRGMALGVTMQLPEDDRHNYSRTYLEKTLAVLLAGRVAEEIIFDQLTTGAGNDIERATKMARKMVCQWGMSDTLGPLSLGENNDHVFLGREIGHNKDYSEQTAQLIDAEIKGFVSRAHAKARQLLEKNIEHLHAMANALLERETISGEDITRLMEGKPLPPMNVAAKVHSEGSSASESSPKPAAETSQETASEQAGPSSEEMPEKESPDNQSSDKPEPDTTSPEKQASENQPSSEQPHGKQPSEDDADDFTLEEPDKHERS
ncbi:MAG: ATP-dependent zinc metalloprotease FtsH [Desulfovibrionales bacterium]|nr:MAG: ATP-dependent zinc metalloprotease FtsH [Desulfovibrionales bacterium]